MTLTMHSITFDCHEPRRLARFWASALAYNTGRMEDDLATAEDPHGQAPRLLFVQVPEGKVVKNRVHLDLRAGDLDAEVARLTELGARTLTLFDFGPGDTFTVMQDPEGNEFCVEQGAADDHGTEAS